MDLIKKRRVLSLFNLAAFIGVIIINTMAVVLPLNNKGTGELSDNNPTLFTPAGLTFSIWSLIYLLLLIFSVYQVIAAFSKDPEKGKVIDDIGILFILSCVANMSWIFAWHYENILFSWIIMLGILISLTALVEKLTERRKTASFKEKAIFHLPFSIYLGWISIATIANTSILLLDLGWNGFSIPASIWTVIVMAAALVLTGVFIFLRGDVFFALVVVWAFYGIFLKRQAANVLYSDIIIASIAGMVLVAAGILIQLVRKKVYKKN